MEFITPAEELSKAFSLIQNCIEKKSTMPILSNVLISAEDGQLKLSGANLEVAVQTLVPVKLITRGSTTVTAKTFGEIVKEINDGEVHIKVTEGERIEIINKKSKFKVIGNSAGEYPGLPGLSIKPSGRIEAKNLLDMIDNTIFAVSTDETRFNLTGVCFECTKSENEVKIIRNKKLVGNNVLRLAATDSHRLAVSSRVANDFCFEDRIIVPRKGLSEVKKLLEEVKDKDILIEAVNGFLVVESENAKISIRLIDGEFPDIHKALPEEEGFKIMMNVDQFSKALRRVLIMVSEKQKSVAFDLSENILRISSSSPELGEAREDIDIEYNGPIKNFCFNARYILDITNNIKEGSIIMEVIDEKSPGKFYSPNDEASIGVVMPMRIE